MTAVPGSPGRECDRVHMRNSRERRFPAAGRPQSVPGERDGRCPLATPNVSRCSTMTITGLGDILPSPRTLLTVGLSALLGGALAFGIGAYLREPAGPPAPPQDPQFVRVGRAYLPGLGKAYAAAWEEGAKGLDAGQPLSAALAAVGKAWDTNRAQLFDQMATPAFAKIVPESQKDADVTPQQRAAMSAAWRGFAAGLSR
jgi:hypothetical protein